MRTGHVVLAVGLLGLGVAAALRGAARTGGGEAASASAPRAGGETAAPPAVEGGPVRSTRPPRVEADGAPQDAPALISALGCGACHTGVPEPVEARRTAPEFGPEGRARPADSLLAVLLASEPRRTTDSPARMPLFHLSRAEALALTLFLESTLPEPPDGGRDRVARLEEEHPEVGPELGRRLFLALDCAGCHDGTGVPAWKSAPELSDEGERARRGWLASWLARPRAVRPSGFYPGTGTRMPDFGLSGAVLRTLMDYLAPAGEEDPAPATGGASGRATSDGPEIDRPPSVDPLSPFREEEAERLLRERSACLGCHAVGGEGGRVGPDLATLRTRRPDGYVWAMIRSPSGTAPRTVMPPGPEGPARDTLLYRLLTSGDLGDGAAAEDAAAASPGSADGGGYGVPAAGPADTGGYLDLVSHPFRAPDDWMLEGDPAPATAAARYRHRCSSCHGVGGGGDGFNAPYLRVPPAPHADSAAMAARTDARLYNATHGGGRVLGRSPRMPAFGGALSREAIWGLVGFVRELCECRGPDWFRDNDESGVPDAPRASTPAAAGSSPGGRP